MMESILASLTTLGYNLCRLPEIFSIYLISFIRQHMGRFVICTCEDFYL